MSFISLLENKLAGGASENQSGDLTKALILFGDEWRNSSRKKRLSESKKNAQLWM